MQSFDTIKFSIPVEAVRSVNDQAFVHTMRTDGATGQSEMMLQARTNSLPVGISSLSYKEGGDFQVAMSAKVLRDDYLTGLNKNNWGAGLKILFPVIDADEYQVWEKAKVFTCDSTNNIPLAEIGGNERAVYRALLTGKMNDRFKEVYYDSRTKRGVEFRGTQQEKNRIIAYAKNLDLLKRENKKFMGELKNPAMMLQAAEKIVRFETNHTTFRSMRDRFGVEENTLKGLMESTRAVNHNFLKKVLNVRDAKQITVFDEWQSFSGAGIDFIQLKGIENIIQKLECNDVAVKQFFKEVLGDQFKYHFYKKKGYTIKTVLEGMKAGRYDIEQSNSATICNLCLDALLRAVA